MKINISAYDAIRLAEDAVKDKSTILVSITLVQGRISQSWSVVFLLIDKDGQPMQSDPNDIDVYVDASNGVISYVPNYY